MIRIETSTLCWTPSNPTLNSKLTKETLSVQPKLASIKATNSMNLDAANADSIQRPADALQVEDYHSVYGWQDFCQALSTDYYTKPLKRMKLFCFVWIAVLICLLVIKNNTSHVS
jgi:hypothetical protein